MKRRLAALVLSMGLLATACGGGAAAPAAPTAGSGSGAFKVAMLLPGKINDQSWNAAGYAALQEVKKQTGADVTYVEDVAPANQNETWRDYAARGYQIIMSWGGQFEDGAKAVAPEFPKTAFVVIDGMGDNGTNYASYNMASEQYYFTGGALSGMVTRSNVVGIIGGLCFADTALRIHGEEQGAKYANPNVKVLSVFTGDFEDPGKAKEAALAMISQGADVLMTNLNAGIQGVVEAAKEKNVLVILENFDQNQLAPKNILSAVIMDQSILAVKAAQAVKDGTFHGKHYIQQVQLGDQLNLAPFHGLAPDSVREKLTQMQKDIASGKIKVKADPSCK